MLEERVAKVKEQYDALLEQTVGLMGDKVKHLKDAEKKLVPKPRKHPVVCIYCCMRNLPCDRGTPCRNCAKAMHDCKRAMCANFKTGVCRNKLCNRAHEEDAKHYGNIVHAGHVRKEKDENKRTKKRARRRG
ncbi:hypothetical protein Ptr902_07975 [Pyrenophora tritici-repentis]|nr:hypothetical protein Ptr902_07975 [Pyrenophora tritici-repentis]